MSQQQQQHRGDWKLIAAACTVWLLIWVPAVLWQYLT